MSFSAVDDHLQEAWAGPQREASGSKIWADEGDGADSATGFPAAWRAGSRDREDQGGWIFHPRPPLHLGEGNRIIHGVQVYLFFLFC